MNYYKKYLKYKKKYLNLKNQQYGSSQNKNDLQKTLEELKTQVDDLAKKSLENLPYPEAENTEFKQEIPNQRDFLETRKFNNELAIKKYVNKNGGLDKFKEGDYVDIVTFDRNNEEKRVPGRIVNINFHGHPGTANLPLYGIVTDKENNGLYDEYSGSSNFTQLNIKNKSINRTTTPIVFKFIEKISDEKSLERKKKEEESLATLATHDDY